MANKLRFPLKVRYALFIGIIHLLVAVLAFYLLSEWKIYFLIVEFLLLISLFLAYRLYRSFIKPLEFIASGIDAIRDQDFNVKFVPTGGREINQLVEVYNGMIDNIREERVQLAEQHFFLQKLMQASPAGILIMDFDGNISDLNPVAKKLLLEQEDLSFPIDIKTLDHPILSSIQELEVGESETVRLEGAQQFRCEVSSFIDRGFTRKFVIIQELSQEILAAEKQAYGKVIRMMAHEVNNSIGAINSLLQSLSDPSHERDQEWITDVDSSLKVAIDRNQRLNRFMRNFAEVVRLPAPQFEQLELNALLQRMGQLLRSRAEELQVKLIVEARPSKVWLKADEQQLEQVIINLVKNSLESIGHDGEIRLLITTSPIGFIVADNGPGIPEEISKDLFSPFFTTKPTGQGVGLTLVRDILINHNTRFSLQTESDGWTRFRIEFDH